MKTDYVKKGLAIGIIVLFIGTSVIPSISGSIDKSRTMEIVNDNENSPFQVTITKLENGIYLNDHKIFPFPVPLVLCGRITIFVVTLNGYGMFRMDVYFNDELQETIIGSGPYYDWTFSMVPFFKYHIKVIVSFLSGESASDEITIWNCFGKIGIISIKEIY